MGTPLESYDDIMRRLRETSQAQANPEYETGDLLDYKSATSRVPVSFGQFISGSIKGLGKTIQAHFGVNLDDPEVAEIFQRIREPSYTITPTFDPKTGVKLARMQRSERSLALTEAVNDIMSGRQFVKMAKDIGGQTKAAFAVGGEMARHPVQGGMQLFSGIAMTFLQPTTDLVELYADTQLVDGSYRRLSQDERVHKIKNIIAFNASLGVAQALRSTVLAPALMREQQALSKTLKSVRAGELEGVRDAAQAAVLQARITEKFAKGKIATDLLAKGTALGAISGATYGSIAYANEDEQLMQILLNGVVFAPLGVAFETLGLKSIRGQHRNNAQIAAEISLLRNFQLAEKMSPSRLTGNIVDMVTSDNMVNALYTGALDPDKANITVLEGVSEQALYMKRTIGGAVTSMRLFGHDVKSKNFRVASYRDKATNTNRVAIIPDYIADKILTGQNQNFFDAHGRFKGERVSVEGKDYYVIGWDDHLQQFKLQSVEGQQQISRAKEHIRSNTTFEFRPVEILESEVYLRGEMLRQMAAVYGKATKVFDQYGTDKIPIQIENETIWARAQTGRPVSAIAFRAEMGRGVTSKRKGLFFSASLTSATSYLGTQAALLKKKIMSKELVKQHYLDAGRRAPPYFTPEEALQNLRIERLSFENPYVAYGSQSSLLYELKQDPHIYAQWGKDIRAAQYALDHVTNYGGEKGYAPGDLIIGKIMRGLGYDGIIYSNGSEIVDLKIHPWKPKAVDKVKQVLINLTAESPARYVDRVYARLKDRMIGKTIGTFGDPAGGIEGAIQFKKTTAIDSESSLNGVPFKAITQIPQTVEEWAQFTRPYVNDALENMPLPNAIRQGSNKAFSTGLVIEEPDGRVWIYEPTNHYGGYEHTFPKGRVEQGLSPQANAIKEVFEETGLLAQITDALGDYEGDTTITRYYRAKRVGGSPKEFGWEAHAVKLVPKQDLPTFLNKDRDKQIAKDLSKSSPKTYNKTGIRKVIEPIPAVNGTSNFLKNKLSEAKGSNTGGIYESLEGDVYYKNYQGMQAHAEAMANSIYRLLGLKAPESILVADPWAGQVGVANKMIDGKLLRDHISDVGSLDQATARKILEGYAADILVSNWDAVGTGFDNVIISPKGEVIRIDQGGTFMYRAQGGLKTSEQRFNLTEFEGFSKYNPYYSQVLKAAGYTPEEFAKIVVKQIDNILDTEREIGGWNSYIDEIFTKYLDETGGTLSYTGSVVNEAKDMLGTRTNLLRDHRNELASKYGIQKDPPASALGATEPRPDFNFLKEIDDLATENGWTGAEKDAFRSYIEERFKQELAGQLPTETRELLTRGYETLNEVTKAEHKNSAMALSRAAITNNMVLDFQEGGNVVIRDTDGNLVHTVSGVEEARKFIDKTGQFDGFKMSDGGADLPPIGGDLLHADSPFDGPHSFFANGKMTRLTDAANTLLPFLTRNREVMISFDNLFGTKLFAKVFDGPQNGRRQSNAKQIAWMVRLAQLDKQAVKFGFDRADRELVTHYLSTMHSSTVIEQFDPERRLSKREIDLAERWALIDQVDLKQVMEVYNGIKEFEKANPAIDPISFRNELYRLTYKISNSGEWDPNNYSVYSNIPDSAKSILTAYYEIQDMFENPNRTVKFGNVARLYRALKNQEDPVKFLKDNPRFGVKHEQFAAAIKQFYTDLGKELGLDPKLARPIVPFMVHAKEYMGGSISSVSEHFGMKKDDFFAQLLSGGEVQPNDFDALHSAVRFTKGAMDAKYFDGLWKQAKVDLKAELDLAIQEGRLPEKARAQIEKVAGRYLADIKGHADAGRMFTEEVLQMTWKHVFGKELEKGTGRKLVNIISSTGEAAAQGFRFAAAIRDFMSGLIISTMRFGPTRTLEIINYGIRGMEGLTPDMLQQMGEIPTSGIVHFADPVEHSQALLSSSRSAITRKMDEFNQLAFRLSLQQDIYKMFHAGHYMSTFKRAGDGIKAVREGKISVQEFGESIKLQKYDAPVVRQFLELVRQGKDEQATRFLAIQTGQDMVGVYGQANHASGWNTNVGRLAGQFGQWSMFFKSTFLREISRGTIRDRVGSAATLFGLSTGMTALGHTFGLNLQQWQPISGLGYTGGPAVDVMRTVAALFGGSDYMKQEAEVRLRRYLPYDPFGEEPKLNIGQIYMPGSFFLQGLVDAVGLASEGDFRAAPRAIGVPIDKEEQPILKLPFVGEVIEAR